jgi:hypothetical protein
LFGFEQNWKRWQLWKLYRGYRCSFTQRFAVTAKKSELDAALNEFGIEDEDIEVISSIPKVLLPPRPDGRYKRGPKRSYSPAPGASPAEEAAIEAMAESRGERVEKSPRSYSPPPLQTVKYELAVDPGTRNWIRALFVLVLGAIGTGVYGVVKPTDVPPPVPLSCQVRCPEGSKQKIDARMTPVELQATLYCCDVMQARLDAAEALSEAAKARELAGKASDKATLLESTTPRVNP